MGRIYQEKQCLRTYQPGISWHCLSLKPTPCALKTSQVGMSENMLTVKERCLPRSPGVPTLFYNRTTMFLTNRGTPQ